MLAPPKKKINCQALAPFIQLPIWPFYVKYLYIQVVVHLQINDFDLWKY